MAGVKGMKGGGGARPGAGRPKKQPEPLGLDAQHDDPARFLRAVMNDPSADARLRVDAAKALMPFVHQKLGEGGKKEQRQQAAEKVASRFAPAAPPKLAAVGGKKV